MTFVALGINYMSVAALRDDVTFDAEAALAFRVKAAEHGVRQVVTLSTCNRCEVFACCRETADIATLAELFCGTFPFAEGLGAALENRTGREALSHLFRVAAGLESMILGEYQILGQVKDAYAAAQATGHVGCELDRIMRETLTCAKKVKTELDLGAVPPSVCRAGVMCVERAIGFAGKSVFVIGSGKTGTLAAHLAVELGASSLAICNRSPERAERLSRECGARVVDYASRYEVIVASDIVVSATASPHVVVRAEGLRLVRPVCFLDLASPRDVDPHVAENQMATLFSIESIGELAAGDRMERERLMSLGDAIVSDAVGAMTGWLDGRTSALASFMV